MRHCKLYQPSHDPVLWGGRWPTGWPTYSCSTHTWCTVSSCRLNSGPEGVAAPSQASQSIKPQDNARHTVEQSERHRAEPHCKASTDTSQWSNGSTDRHKERTLRIFGVQKGEEKRSQKYEIWVSHGGDYRGFRPVKMEAVDCYLATKLHGVTFKLQMSAQRNTLLFRRPCV